MNTIHRIHHLIGILAARARALLVSPAAFTGTNPRLMSIRFRTAGLLLAVAAAVGLTAAAALPASASTGYYKIFVQVAGSKIKMCLQPDDPARGPERLSSRSPAPTSRPRAGRRSA
jgi:hypothetical protein